MKLGVVIRTILDSNFLSKQHSCNIILGLMYLPRVCAYLYVKTQMVLYKTAVLPDALLDDGVSNGTFQTRRRGVVLDKCKRASSSITTFSQSESQIPETSASLKLTKSLHTGDGRGSYDPSSPVGKVDPVSMQEVFRVSSSFSFNPITKRREQVLASAPRNLQSSGT